MINNIIMDIEEVINKKDSSDAKNIFIKGEFKQYPVESQICKSLFINNIIDINQFKLCSFNINLSKTTYFDIGTLVWFIAFLNKLKLLGNDIQIKLPDYNSLSGQSSWDFLNRWKFFEALEECVDNPVNLIIPEQIKFINATSKYKYPQSVIFEGSEAIIHKTNLLEITPIKSDIYEYKNIEDLIIQLNRNTYDGIISSSLYVDCGWDYETTHTYMREILSEGVRNSLKYSKGSYTLIGMKKDRKNLNLAICDNGNGIPDVLRNAFDFDEILKNEINNKSDVELIKLYTDADLIKLSTEAGIRSDYKAKGMGLFHLKRFVLEMGGELRIRSGSASVDFVGKKIFEKHDDLINFQGTLLRIQTPLK
jgi:hypothetical protein